MAALEMVKKNNESTIQQIEFMFRAPEAKKYISEEHSVIWNTKSLPMKKCKDGTWRILVKLSRGRDEYRYFVETRHGHKIFLA